MVLFQGVIGVELNHPSLLFVDFHRNKLHMRSTWNIASHGFNKYGTYTPEKKNVYLTPSTI